MKNVLLGLGLGFASVAMAGSHEGSAFDIQADMRDTLSTAEVFISGHNEGKKCGKKAWQAAKVSDEQNESAKAILVPAYERAKEQLPAIREALGTVRAALEKHPIDKTEVTTALSAARDLGTPVKQSLLEAHIDVINLLSVEQRNDFNAAFIACMKDSQED